VATFLVSYDAAFLKTSLPRVYDHVDTIVLSVDRNRQTWSGNTYDLPDGLFEWVRSIDRDGKISVFEESFYLPGWKPLELDTRQRQMSAEYAGMDDTWHIQVDADEYIMNVEALVACLRREEQTGRCDKDILYLGKWVPLFKQDARGFFYVENGDDFEVFPVAAISPTYVAARKTAATQRVILDVIAVHQTFARDPAALRWKLSNWGHSDELGTESYLRLWQAVDRHNYRYLANFHPTYPRTWKRLEYIEAPTIEGFAEQYMQMRPRHPAMSETSKPFLKRVVHMSRRVVRAAVRKLRHSPKYTP